MMVSQNSNLTLRSIPTSKVDQTLQAFFPSEGCVCVCPHFCNEYTVSHHLGLITILWMLLS